LTKNHNSSDDRSLLVSFKSKTVAFSLLRKGRTNHFHQRRECGVFANILVSISVFISAFSNKNSYLSYMQDFLVCANASDPRQNILLISSEKFGCELSDLNQRSLKNSTENKSAFRNCNSNACNSNAFSQRVSSLREWRTSKFDKVCFINKRFGTNILNTNRKNQLV
jgi:hypothetical protein